MIPLTAEEYQQEPFNKVPLFIEFEAMDRQLEYDAQMAAAKGHQPDVTAG